MWASRLCCCWADSNDGVPSDAPGADPAPPPLAEDGGWPPADDADEAATGEIGDTDEICKAGAPKCDMAGSRKRPRGRRGVAHSFVLLKVSPLRLLVCRLEAVSDG